MLNSSIRFIQTSTANGHFIILLLPCEFLYRSHKAKQIKVADLFTILWPSDSQAFTVMENVFTDVHSLTTVLHTGNTFYNDGIVSITDQVTPISWSTMDTIHLYMPS